MQPLDLARTRLAADVGTAANREFKGLRDCLETIYRKQGPTGGFRGLYLGFNPYAVFLYRAIYFGLYDTGRPILFPDITRANLFHMWGFAQLIGMIAGQIAYPFDTVRRRMMMQAGRDPAEVMYKGPVDAFRKIYKNEGIMAFYRGAIPNAFRSSALVLFAYDGVKLIHPLP